MSLSTQDTMASAATSLIADLASQNDTPAEWAARYADVLDPSKATRLHLAIFVEPFLSWVVDGTKTVESRFSAVRCAPWDAVNEDDVVLMKQSSGPVIGAFVVSFVSSYQIDDGDLDSIRELFGHAICVEADDFWSDRSAAKYATLMGIADHHEIEPTPIPKRDRRGWVVIDETRTISPTLLDDE